MPTRYVTIDGFEHVVSVEGEDVRLDGAPASGAVHSLGNGVFSVLLGGESIRVILSGNGEGGEALCRGIAAPVAVESERTRLLKRFGGVREASARRLEVRAPMPALVARVEVSAGQSVNAGEALLVLEAMKMENELRAPHAGIVAEVCVAKGATVEKGALLIRFE